MTSINFDFSLSTSTPAVSGWPKVLLSDVADINAKTARIKEMGVINYTDISSVGTRTVQSPAVLKSHEAPSRAKRLLTEGDTVISTVRPNRKSYFFFNGQWDNAVASTGFVVISPKDLQDANFIHYILTSEDASALYERICEGGAYPAFNGNQLASLEIPWPEPEIRNFIGSSIANLDRKIETNIELSKILEDIAQTIFKSWFIDFDPVKAKMAGEKPVGMDDATAALFPDSMEDSELGLIPKGWKSVALDNFASVRYGAPFASKLFNVSAVGSPLIRIRDLKNQSIATWTTDRLAKGFFVKAGQLLVGMDGEFNPTLWFGEDSLVNQRICLIDNNQEISSLYLYFSLLPIMKRIEHGSTGSTVIHLGKSDIDAIRIMHPGIELLENYKTIVSPMLDEIVSLSKQSRNLQLIRDVLLPRLISGELQIPDEMLAS